MTRDTLAVALFPEETECTGHVLADPLALGHGVGECWDPAEFDSAVAVASREGLEGRVILCLGDSVVDVAVGAGVGILGGDHAWLGGC